MSLKLKCCYVVCPQIGCQVEVKAELYDKLDEVVESVSGGRE